MNPQDARLVADLIMLGDKLPALVDEVLAGQLDHDERRALALVFATIAAELNPNGARRAPSSMLDPRSIQPSEEPGPMGNNERFTRAEVEEIVEANPHLQGLSEQQQADAVEQARQEQRAAVEKPPPRD